MTTAPQQRRPQAQPATTRPQQAAAPTVTPQASDPELKAALQYAATHPEALVEALNLGRFVYRPPNAGIFQRPIYPLQLKGIFDRLDRAALLDLRKRMQACRGLEFYAALATRFGGNYALAVQKRIGVQTDLSSTQLTFHAFVEQLTNRVSYMNDVNLDTLARDQDLQDADHDGNTQELESGVKPQQLLAFFGYHAGPPVSGLWGFQMRLFTPVPLAQIRDPAVRARRAQFSEPIVVFRGTEGVQATTREGGVDTMVGDFAKASVGVNQINANWDLIQLTMTQVKQAVFAGHSLGGGLAQVAAARMPGKVAEVITFQAPGLPKDLAAQFTAHSDAHSTHYRVAGDIVPQSGDTHLPGEIEYLTRFTQAGGLSKAAVDGTSSHVAYPLTTVLQGMDPTKLTPEQRAIVQYGAHDRQESGGTQARMTVTGSLNTKQDPRLKVEWARSTVVPAALNKLGYVEEMVQKNLGYNLLLEATQDRLKRDTTYELFRATYLWLGTVQVLPMSQTQNEMMSALGLPAFHKPMVPLPSPMKDVADHVNIPVGLPVIPSYLTQIRLNGGYVAIKDRDRQRVRENLLGHWTAWHPGQTQGQAWLKRLQQEGQR
ncbi:lipase family protein [Deinococcus radiotolerans]|uniref:DUF2974 domain-containing protein n=1 Tax=Deinococcus radiotolerans TaxID=1309407 RepID=A0ABQ2FNC6_9DEIO|nr:Mbeg1-like protein [Deinococcus radiotolerans]GGL10944.1 hypothetical protein GCM10010844_32050 [Deinococcus radiotolerans]